jgi:hypothetical protein
LYEDKDFNQFHGKGLWEKGRGFPFVCSGHGMKAVSPYKSRAQEMIDLQLRLLQNMEV